MAWDAGTSGSRSWRSPGRGRRWWRSSASRSSRPRSGCRPTPVGTTWVRRSSCGTGCPRLWARVIGGDLAAWRARRIARATLALSPEAAAYVDRHVAHVAHKIRPATVDRLVEEAIARFMPDTAERARRDAADARGFTIDHRQVSFAGTSQVYGELDLADALDLDAAIGGIAGQLGDLGCTESLDVRRSMAAGELARRQLALDLTTDPDRARRGSTRAADRRGRGQRERCCTSHLAEAAVTSTVTAPGAVAELQGGSGGEHPDTDDHRHHPDLVWPHGHRGDRETGDRPDRPRPRRVLRNPRPTHRTDRAPGRHLCVPVVHPAGPILRHRPRDPARPRRTNLLDTISRPCAGDITGSRPTAPWTYTALEPGTYLWSSPHGYQFLRDHTGTLDVCRDRPRPPAVPPED